jgi:hypothetical protein
MGPRIASIAPDRAPLEPPALRAPVGTRVVPVDLETYLRVHFTLDPERDPDLAHT